MRHFTLIFLAIITLLNKPITTKAQVNVNDSLALVALYNSTNGPQWYNKTNWLTSKPVNKWYGIAVSSKRVSGIGLYSNNLKGSIPAELGNITNLTGLDLDDNQLTGSIPAALGNCEGLFSLHLENNQLSGSIPAELGNCDLQQVYLDNNKLSGSIPAELANHKDLFLVFLNNNQLSGNIPVELGNCKDLMYLFLNNNQLKGRIPAELGNCQGLLWLYLNNNQLSGSIPGDLGKIPDLDYLYLNNNELNGSIPAELSNLRHLENLYLDSNRLSGSIPAELGSMNVHYLDLTSNHLSGSIPAELGNIKRLSILQLGDNQLSGTIPSSLGNLYNLRYLILAHNQLTGKIPASFINLKKLTRFSVRNNNLSDTVPEFLGTLPSILILDVLLNNFTFDGIEKLSQSGIETFNYNTQRGIKIHRNHNILSVYAGGTLSNNTYKWYKDGALVSTIKSDSTFKPTMSGAYTVRITNAIAKELRLYSDTVSFTPLKAVEQNNIAVQTLSEDGFSMYPNPAKNIVTIVFAATGNYIIKLTDLSGNMLQTKTGVGIEGKNRLQFDVSKYAAGVYFITIMNGQKQTETFRLNKQ